MAVGRTRAKQIAAAKKGDEVFPSSCTATPHLRDKASAPRRSTSLVQGYNVGGTIHVIVNNLIGFTTEPPNPPARFSSDLAKRLPIPIFHVNAEDPDAVVRVARIALDYRYEFGNRCRHRPDRLSPSRPQRSGRSHHHAAASLRANQESSAALGNLCATNRCRSPLGK